MNISTILVPVDFSDITGAVVAFAAQLAQGCQSRLVLLHVSEPDPDFVGYEPGPASVRTAVAKDFRVEHQQLEALKQSVSGVETSALHIQGPLAEKILAEAEQQGAGMIVLGSHGHGALYHLFAGSVATAVLKEARCPVVVVPAPRRA